MVNFEFSNINAKEGISIDRVERHIINRNHKMWNICDEYCFKSKNLYNYANYELRQVFIYTKKVEKYSELTRRLKTTEVFKEIGSNSGQHTLKMLDKAWKSFLISIKDYYKTPSKYLGKPKLPGYKEKNGRYMCILTNMQSQIKEGYLYFAFKPFKPYNYLIRTKIKGKHMQTRIIPKGGCYILEIVYQTKDVKEREFNNRIMGIDLGINNFVTMTNNIGYKPIVINGKGLKSINQYYNKQLSKYRGLAKTNNNLDWTKRLDRINMKRYNKLEYFMHCASRIVIDYCIRMNINTIVIGINKEWKQECRIGSNTQNFIQIPYDNFIKKLEYKCKENGIKLITTEESYTSGTSFIDNELPIKENYNKSRRKYRGLFISNKGISINADANGSYQIIKKVFPNAFANGIKGVDLHPIVINY
ncbi:transposase [[Clostridium] sordellii]|uniref:RNA-guided endonuclease InsQ/TnpB family protein n=1 Tax=Paraclostridium sordellii TaxID=1505 RepID=UPI0005EA27BE|nr:transposase [Paeniclostridium sordellii]CEQ01700.1 transposase [[Clostridium] sordellii] [Paeniclostridium sordellii]